MNVRQGKDLLSTNSLVPIYLFGNPPHSLCFKLPVPYQDNRVDRGTWSLLHSCWFSTVALSPRNRQLKTDTHMLCCHSTRLQSKERQQAEHPFLGVTSASEDQALEYLLCDDLNKPFSLPLLETLAALLKHKHNQV